MNTWSLGGQAVGIQKYGEQIGWGPFVNSEFVKICHEQVNKQDRLLLVKKSVKKCAEQHNFLTKFKYDFRMGYTT